MKLLFSLIQKAKTSKKHLWLLNRVMNHAVPFNKPHGFQILRITDDQVETSASYQKKNFNHVKGIHACSIATVGELAAGLVIMSNFSPLEYRVIMSNINIDYHYQAKKNIVATAMIAQPEKEAILKALSQDGKTLQTITTDIRDEDQKQVATVKSTWQIKPWKDVRTQM